MNSQKDSESSPLPQTEIKHIRDLSPQQKKSGLAAWLGWMFDGLDMHLYTLVATPFVAVLMSLPSTDPEVGRHGAMINAAFLIGWALGGAFFGKLGDKIGRSRTLVLTILCYAAFTGLSAIAQTWWQLMILRFLSALGIGGEWAVGASLLSETWPKKWRPWIAATLQSAVNIGVLLACVAGWFIPEPRYLFLIGVLPALLTLWIRRSVPETEEWTKAHARGEVQAGGFRGLFTPDVRGATWRAVLICAVSLTAHWTFMYWQQSYIRALPEVRGLAPDMQTRAAVIALSCVMVGSILGNYLAGWLALRLGYRRAISIQLACYCAAMLGAFSQSWSHGEVLAWFFLIGTCQGVFGLFTMCLPPLFPTLLRTTGAGFCYNIGRIVAAGGTVYFGLFTKVNDYSGALFFAGFLFAPAALVALLLPKSRDDEAVQRAT